MKENKTTNRILELDALRGILAISIVLFHYTTYYNFVLPFKYHPPFYFPWLPYRLQLFAVISGFVIPMAVERIKSPMEFVVARFSRLYPCYLFAVIFIASLMTQFPLPGKSTTWPLFFVNITMLQGWFGYNNIDGVFWFLPPEIAFYVIIFLLFALNKMKYIEEVGLLGLILVVLNARYGSFWPAGMADIINHSRILCFWQYFLAGILFYNLKSKGDTWWRHAGLALCFIVQNVITDDIYNIFCFGGCILVFYAYIYGKLSWIAQKPFLFLGTISYSLYLIHQNMGQMIISYLHKAGANGWLQLIIPTIVSIVIATLMTFLIEKPVMRYARARYIGWHQRRIGPL